MTIGGCTSNKKGIDDSKQSSQGNKLVVGTFNVDRKAPDVKVEDQRKQLSDNIEIKKVETLKTNLSDHLLLIVRLELK